MARSRKKTLGQQVVGAAAIAMPAPVQRVVGSRWGARLILLVAPLLFIAGVLTVDWSDGMPKIRVNRQRAQEVRQKIVSEVEADVGMNVGPETRPSWGRPNDQPMAAPMQQYIGYEQPQQPVATFPRLESAANSATGLLETPAGFYAPQYGGAPQMPATSQPGARY
jgi:hypothetical protein